MVSSVKDAAWIDWITRLMGESPVPDAGQVTLPSSAYYCLLDEQPTHLVPQRLLADANGGAGSSPLMVDPRCFFAHRREVPSELADRADLFENFAPGEIVWVRDPATEMSTPFWLGPEFISLLQNAEPGYPEPCGLPNRARSILMNAGILVEQDYASRRRKEWMEIVLQCRRAFEKGYVPIGCLIHPFHVAALRRYYRCLIRTGRVRLGDNQSPIRYVAHNESVARFFHHQLTTVVTDIVGEPVKPSYVYLSTYLAGAELEKHTDRPQCEFSITLCLDHSPEPVRETPWPLYLETNYGLVTVYQALGDALLYRGRELPHYRHPLPHGRTSTSIFFHYVRADFNGSLS